MNTAIIVAAGQGRRFGAGKPKQFIEVHGKPLIIYTIEKFVNCDVIDEIILVLSSEETSNFEIQLTKFNFQNQIKITTGGATRAESVLNGLNLIEKNSAGIVAVHDGARPLVSIEEIARTIETARKHGAACLVGKVTDTIKEIAPDGTITGTIDRENLRRALTPQCFRYEILKRAFEENTLDESVTDECYLVEKLGIKITVVEGSAQNIKITTPADLTFAENLLK